MRNSALLLAGALLFVGCLYSLTLPPTITFEDAGLFAQVCHMGGIAHPPGYPLFSLLCEPAFKLGVDPALTGSIISMGLALMTLAALFFVMRRLGSTPLVSCLTILLLGVSLQFWSQSLIIEVYTLNTFLFTVFLLCCIHFSERPSAALVFWTGLVCGLGFSNHWPLIVASGPGLLLIFLSTWPRSHRVILKPATLVAGAIGLLIGLLPYLHLFLKPEGTFGYSGAISSLSDLLAYMRRDAFAGVDQSATANVMDKLAFVYFFAHQLAAQLTFVSVPVAVYGLYAGLRENRLVHTGLLLIFLGNSALLIALLGFEFTFTYQTAFSHYPLLAYIIWCIWIGTALSSLLSFLANQPSHLKKIVPVLIGLLIVAVTSLNFSRSDRSQDSLAEDYAQAVLQDLPPETILVIDADAQVGSLGYAIHVSGLRPDVVFFERNGLFTNESVMLDRGEQQSFLLEMSKTRPVVAIGANDLPTASEHGIYQRVGQPEQSQYYIANPAYLTLAARLAKRFDNNDLNYPADREFAHEFLIGAGHHLYGRSGEADFTKEELMTLIAVQESFPGAIAVVSTAMATGLYTLDDQTLLSLLTPHIDNIPGTASKDNRTQFDLMVRLLVERTKTTSSDAR